MPLRPFLLLCLTALLQPFTALAEEGGRWPFGGRGGGVMMSRGRDLYNLGLLGVKARDPKTQSPPTNEPVRTGRQSFRGGARPSHDNGPDSLVVELLFPGGPAEQGGLKPGDEIVGVGRSPFREGSFEPLAKALLKAESGKGKGVVTLLVMRPGQKKRIKVDVTLPVTGKHAARPTEGAGRSALVTKALAWLAEQQGGRGGYPATTSGTNGVVVQVSLAGLAWLAGGSDLEQGPHKENVERALDFVRENAGRSFRVPAAARGGDESRLAKMAGMDQSNWGFAHAAIFLGELQARTPSTKCKEALYRCAKALADQQELSGGWAHGRVSPNPLGYTELNIVTGLALCGLGLAQRAGWEIPEGVVEKAEAYLKASSSGDGGVGYSAEPGQKGMGNIGRTAGCWLGYMTLGLGGSDWGRKMKKFADRNVADVMDGHASLMQHILLAGVAAPALGAKAKKRYWDAMERHLVLARAPDGSFQPRPWHETLTMSSNSDVMFGQVWTTAAWAVVLACEPNAGGLPGLPAWQGAAAR